MKNGIMSSMDQDILSVLANEHEKRLVSPPNVDEYMYRMFLPVGQGAFYCEQFHISGKSEPFIMVYDCGVLHLMDKNQDELRKKFQGILKEHFPKSKTINALFISHLDEDHVNGLKLLEEEGFRIEHFFLPAIADQDRSLMEMWFEATEQNGLASKIFMDANAVLGEMFPRSQIHTVPESTEQRDSDPTPHPDADPNSTGNPTSLFHHWLGRMLPLVTSSFIDWEFLPFNYRLEEYVDTLRSELADKLHLSEPVTNDQLHDQWLKAEGKKTIKKVFSDVFPGWGGKKFHTNSLCLFSGPRGNALRQDLSCAESDAEIWKKQLINLPAGGLYTGDYEAKDDAKKTKRPNRMKALMDAYTDYWENIGCVQIPHHGSKDNFDDEFLAINAIFVASAGSKNSYGHPSDEVRTKLGNRNKHLFCVTEVPCTFLRSLVYDPKRFVLNPQSTFRVHQFEMHLRKEAMSDKIKQTPSSAK